MKAFAGVFSGLCVMLILLASAVAVYAVLMIIAVKQKLQRQFSLIPLDQVVVPKNLGVWGIVGQNRPATLRYWQRAESPQIAVVMVEFIDFCRGLNAQVKSNFVSWWRLVGYGLLSIVALFLFWIFTVCFFSL